MRSARVPLRLAHCGTELALLVCGLTLAACGTERIELRPNARANVVVEGDDEAASAGEPPAGSDAPADTAGGGSGSEDYPGVDTGIGGDPSFEFGPQPVPPSERGCKKADLLFVVDNSLSMFDEQSNLIQSFPRFMQVVQGTLGFADFHIMVVDTDGANLRDVFGDLGGGLAAADSCEAVLGAGRRQRPNGESCGLATASRYLVEGQPELANTFSCIATVGTSGLQGERPVDALLGAIGEPLNQAGACNDSFLRDDAILVVTIISDEDDTTSAREPADWQQALLQAKQGNEDALVVLGLLGDNNLEGGLCGAFDADAAPRLQSFTEGLGLVGSVCAPDYAPFFERAVGWIAATCADFVPPPVR